MAPWKRIGLEMKLTATAGLGCMMVPYEIKNEAII